MPIWTWVWWPIASNQRNNNNNNNNKKKLKNENKKIYSEEKPTQLSWLMSAKPDT